MCRFDPKNEKIRTGFAPRKNAPNWLFLFVFENPLLSAGKMRFSKTKKQKPKIGPVLNIKKSNLGPVFNSTVYIYIPAGAIWGPFFSRMNKVKSARYEAPNSHLPVQQWPSPDQTDAGNRARRLTSNRWQTSIILLLSGCIPLSMKICIKSCCCLSNHPSATIASQGRGTDK